MTRIHHLFSIIIYLFTGLYHKKTDTSHESGFSPKDLCLEIVSQMEKLGAKKISGEI